VAFITTFSAAIPCGLLGQDERIQDVQKFFQYLSSAPTADVKRQQGMSPLA